MISLLLYEDVDPILRKMSGVPLIFSISNGKVGIEALTPCSFRKNNSSVLV
jgi:hypothetical protein